MSVARMRTRGLGPLLLCLTWLSPLGAYARSVTRGPYLQRVTPTSIIVRWRTSAATDSEVRYGTSPGSLTSAVSGDVGSPKTEHELAITGVSAATQYFYSVGTTAQGPLVSPGVQPARRQA